MPNENPQAAHAAMYAGPAVGDSVRVDLDRVSGVLPEGFPVPDGATTLPAVVLDRFGPVGAGRIYTVRIGGEGDAGVSVSLEEAYVNSEAA